MGGLVHSDFHPGVLFCQTSSCAGSLGFVKTIGRGGPAPNPFQLCRLLKKGFRNSSFAVRRAMFSSNVRFLVDGIPRKSKEYAVSSKMRFRE